MNLSTVFFYGAGAALGFVSGLAASALFLWWIGKLVEILGEVVMEDTADE